jgi:hypothetical protein
LGMIVRDPIRVLRAQLHSQEIYEIMIMAHL